MTTSEHAARNAQQIAVLREGLVGSGYRPTVYCLNQGCHAPICVTALECPDCGTPTRRHEPAPLTVDARALRLLGLFGSLRTRTLAAGLELPYDTTTAVLRALEEAGTVRACAGRWQLTGGRS